MSDDLFQRAVRAWLEDGSDRTPRAAIDAVLLAVKTTPQERDLRILRRYAPMPTYLRLAAAIAIIAVVGFAAASYLGPRPDIVGQPAAKTLPRTATPALTASPSPAPAVLAPLDTSAWVPYTSSRYGFSLRMPSGWTAEPADHVWMWENDGLDFATSGADRFRSPGDQILVSVWRVPSTAAHTGLSWADVEVWAKAYCEKIRNTDCATIHDRVVPMCVESRDCHPALLIPFRDDVQAFADGGDAGVGLVVAVWRGESAPETSVYGGSRRLLEGFLETLNIVPPVYQEAKDAAATFVATGR